MHERNKHQGRYPMSELIATCPDLRPHVRGDTIDFSHPTAVRLLNKALLKQYYQIEGWDLPEGYLCPPIPGRADYVHHLADLIGQRGDASRILDIGVGANVIYPLLGNREYGWSFVGSDIDPRALSHAKKIVAQNHLPIELRLQPARQHILRQILRALRGDHV
jgi:23S rRNA (adenine1618-N6)-methyltransferase